MAQPEHPILLGKSGILRKRPVSSSQGSLNDRFWQSHCITATATIRGVSGMAASVFLVSTSAPTTADNPRAEQEKMAGAHGIEPWAFGFGDRRSTS